jgi:cell surface protein SprA
MSEKVILDGVTLKINEDYFIDYDLGILTILKESLINENSVIDVSYDYSPFGSSSSGSTLVGFRSQYDFDSRLSVGGSFIYEFSAKDTVLPDLYNTPSSSLVGEMTQK